MLKKVLPVLTVVLFGITVISCIMIADTMMRSNAEIKDFESLAALTQKQLENESNQTTTESKEDETSGTSIESPETEPKPIFTRNLTPLFEKNNECIGWICISDTAVDYPVMHTPQDQEKYLRKNFDCEYSSSGVPFMQGNNTLESDNIIIYGHNMKNGTMFSDITKYRNETFCTEHPTIEFETGQGLKLYSVFAVVQIKNNDSWYSLVNQLERSSTSIGANIHEANYAHSKADFVAKFQIALKECYETEYWLELFVKFELLDRDLAKDLYNQCGTIRRMLIASINTAKENEK